MKKRFKKNPTRKKVSKIKLDKGGIISGTLYIAGILAILIIFGSAMIGGSKVKLKDMTPPSTNPYSCCDSGDGEDCYPLTEKRITYDGSVYALLKSNIYQGEVRHIQATDSYTPDGRRIFVNISDHNAHYPKVKNCEPGKDLIAVDRHLTGNSKNCVGIPNDEIIYVCMGSTNDCNNTVNIGSEPFDAYFRLKDGAVPKEIAYYCPKPETTVAAIQQKIVNLDAPSGTGNLQLQTFQIQTSSEVKNTWLSAWCKPADYFYPTTKTNIHFDVKPVGDFVYTIPEYSQGGWNFTADPESNITYKGETYPYIYWDAAIPNNLITEPTKGYSIEYSKLSTFLTDLMPKLGLNSKETKHFTDYWTKQLPKSNYYFIGIIPENQINSLAPISITPNPDSILRVSLYFKPIDKHITVDAPEIKTFNRHGFSVIEWGGLFDTQKHPGFTCYM